MKIGQNGTYKHVLDVLMKNTPPTGGDVRKMNARGVQKVNVRSDSEQKMRRRKKLQKIFSENISLNISVIYSCKKKNTPAGPQFVPSFYVRTLQTKCNNIKLKENGTPHIDRNRLLPTDRQPRLYRTGNRIQRVHDHSRIPVQRKGKCLPDSFRTELCGNGTAIPRCHAVDGLQPQHICEKGAVVRAQDAEILPGTAASRRSL